MRCNLLFIFSIIFIIVLNNVIAVKPGTQISEGDNILEIRIPQADHIQQGADVHVNIHVFNKTTGLSVGEAAGISCYVDLYNQTGAHFISVAELDRDGIEFELDISGSNFTTLGAYSFMIYCNNSILGGFVSGGFEVTTTGEDHEINNLALAFLIVIPLFISIFFLIVSWMLDPLKYWALKLGLILLGFTFIFQAYHFGNLVISEFFPSENITNAIGDATWIFGMSFVTLFFIFLITFIYDIFMLFDNKKHKTGEYP